MPDPWTDDEVVAEAARQLAALGDSPRERMERLLGPEKEDTR